MPYRRLLNERRSRQRAQSDLGSHRPTERFPRHLLAVALDLSSRGSERFVFPTFSFIVPANSECRGTAGVKHLYEKALAASGNIADLPSGERINGRGACAQVADKSTQGTRHVDTRELQTKAVQLLDGEKPVYEFWFGAEVLLQSKPASAGKALDAVKPATLLGAVAFLSRPA